MRAERYRLIAQDFATAIRDGTIPAGTRLPTHRELAAKYGVALATATKVYRELASTGLVVGERGRGTFVRDLSGFGGLDSRRLPIGARIADLSFNQPLAPGQDDQLRHALRELAAEGDLTSLLTQHPPGGRGADRATVAEYLRTVGVDTGRDDVVVTSGAQHALDAVIAGVVPAGRAIAVDALTYPGLKLIADTRRVELVPVGVTAAGTDVDDLDALCRARAVAAIYLVPTLHNPLGFVLDEAARTRIVDIARRHDCLLIEDSTYAFLEPGAPPPLHTLAPERTFHVGSLSKNLATGLRFGYVVAPARQRDAVKRVLRASHWGTSSIVTALATRLLADGTVERLQAQRRADARRRQLIAARELTDLGYHAHPSAYWGWLTLPDDIRADIVAHRLADSGVLVSTADAFAVATNPPNALRIALANPPLAELDAVLRTIRGAVRVI